MKLSASVLGIGLLIVTVAVLATSSVPGWQQDTRLQKVLDDESIQGSIVIYDAKNQTWLGNNRERAQTPFLPASTFKIFNALVALETGVLKDEKHALKWDGVQRKIPAWNKDHNLATAMQASTVWFYQTLARDIGEARMKNWLAKVGYGNASIEGGVDRFWLDGGLRISQLEQINFLQKLHAGSLPFSQRSQEIVRKIILRDQGKDWQLHAKTGWDMGEKHNRGWYVGWLQNKDRVWFFATHIDMKKGDDGANRERVTRAALRAVIDDAMLEAF